jgi:hypothetical protein
MEVVVLTEAAEQVVKMVQVAKAVLVAKVELAELAE